MKNQVTAFVRVKPDTHCLGVILKLKRHKVIWNIGHSALIIMDKDFYDMDHDWLVKRQYLSCFTEIQLIKPKV